MPSYVYIANAEDGEIAAYTLTGGGDLVPLGRTRVGQVYPLCVSPDRRRLYAAVRSKPFSVHVFDIDPASGALKVHSSAPLADSFPFLSLDHTGRFLFGASYSGHVISINAVGTDGRVAERPLQVIPVGRNAHSILPDRSNRFVFVPCLGTDQVFQFKFDPATGLRSNTPAVVQMQPGAGPRHFAFSGDNRFAYVLSELQATVTTFALDAKTGRLSEVASAAPRLDPRLRPGAPRGPDAPPRERDNDIWAADIHLTPDGRYLYASERTSNSISAYRVDAASGQLAWLGSTPTEQQPRGFAVDPQGKFLIASGEKSSTVSVHAIGPDGQPAAARRFPGGKGGNWVEIVAF
jgi:6-phosphogluconolactonase